MPPRQRSPIQIDIAGGWATDMGPSFTGAPAGGRLAVPWLVTAENVGWSLDGWPKKIGGSSRLNATAITEAAVAVTVEGLIDYWKQGTAGSEAQDRVAVAGTKYLKEDADGTWDDIVTGKEANKTPCFTIFKDDCVISTTSNVDVPYVWDQSAGAILGGTPPNFAFSIEHRSRLQAAGVATNPSRLYYCEFLDHEDWTGDGAGSIDVAPDDGDRIIGLASHKGDLLIFKGPHTGSIWRLTGSSPSGDDPFVLHPFVKGVGAVAHNAIVRAGTASTGEDLVFVSPIGIHSLNATANYGDFTESFLSRPIQTWFDRQINHQILPTTWGVNDRQRGRVLWTVAPSGGTAKTEILMLDYRFSPFRWSRWVNYVAAHSLALLEVTGESRVFAGMTTGYVQQLDVAGTLSLPGPLAYTAQAATPALSFGSFASLKSIEKGYLLLKPKGDYTLDFLVKRDAETTVTTTVSQAGSGGVLGSFVLGTDTLGSTGHRIQPFDVDGTFREVELAFRQNVSNQDMEPHGLEVHVQPAGTSEEVY